MVTKTVVVIMVCLYHLKLMVYKLHKSLNFILKIIFI